MALPLVGAEGEQATPATKPHVVLTELRVPQSDPIARQVARTITNSLELIMRLTGTVTVERADFLTPNHSLITARKYYSREETAAAVFGNVVPAKTGGYTIKVEIWSSTKAASKPVRFTKTITDVLSAFDIADQLSLEVASNVVGRKLQFGTLEVRNTSSLSDFSVYADGQLLGRDSTNFRVLSGARTIIIAKPGPLGDQPVQAFQVTVKPNQRTVVTLKTPKTAKTAQAQKPEKPAAPRAAKKAAPAHPTGSLTVESTPAGATVYLNQKVLGKTPLNLFGVPAGSHTLRLQHPFFLPTSEVVQITSGQTTTAKVPLEVNQNDPALTAHLLSPGRASIDSLIWTLTQAAFTGAPFLFNYNSGVARYISNGIGNNFGNVPVSIPTILNYGSDVAFLRIGHHVAHDRIGSAILDIAGVTAGAVYVGDQIALKTLEQRYTQTALYANSTYNTLSGIAYAVPIGIGALSIFYDLVFSPQAAVRYNHHLVQTVAKTGKLPKPDRRLPHSIIVEAGGGAIARLGYRFAVVPNFFSVDAVIGVAAVSYVPFKPAASLEARFEVEPFRASTGALRPVLFAAVGGASDLSQWSATVGGGIGADMLFGPFDLFTRSGYRFGLVNGTSDGEFTVGVRF